VFRLFTAGRWPTWFPVGLGTMIKICSAVIPTKMRIKRLLHPRSSASPSRLSSVLWYVSILEVFLEFKIHTSKTTSRCIIWIIYAFTKQAVLTTFVISFCLALFRRSSAAFASPYYPDVEKPDRKYIFHDRKLTFSQYLPNDGLRQPLPGLVCLQLPPPSVGSNLLFDVALQVCHHPLTPFVDKNTSKRVNACTRVRR